MVMLPRAALSVADPVNVALEIVGDPWTLLVVRDIVFYGKTTFKEFLSSEERITTSVLADRLSMLLREGMVDKTRSAHDRRSELYTLTEKGLALIPVLIELADWGVRYGAEVIPDPLWISEARADPRELRELVNVTVKNGGSVWNGPGSVISQLGQRNRDGRSRD